jgi:16S rRNA (adenine1518-N6/adenine1519-N6)-dimethyltransferase
MSDARFPKAKRSFGQNFLVEQSFIAKIVRSADLDSSSTVIEIGPGRGALTRELLRHAGKVVAIELDRDLASLLREEFADRVNFQLIERDALEVDFSEIALENGSLVKLVANLPYNISTAILSRLIDARHSFSAIILMFQREVVERITAEPATSDRGYLTILVEAFMNVERLFDVPPTAFRPVPKVWSSVVRLTPKDTTIFDSDRELFMNLVSTAFRQKRKTLHNNLKHASPLNIADANDLLRSAGIDPARRAETLSIDEWEALFREVLRHRVIRTGE